MDDDRWDRRKQRHQYSKEIDTFFTKNSEFWPHPLIFRLHKGPVVSVAGPNFVKFLKDLAEEQKFAVTYVEMDEPVEGGG